MSKISTFWTDPLHFWSFLLITFSLNLLFIKQAVAFQGSSEPEECYLFHEKDGMVVMEVESVAATGDWELKTDYEGLTGSGYYEWTGADHFYVGGEGTLRYNVMIENSGLYQFQLRSYNPDTDHTEHNDVWLRFPGHETILDNHEKIPADEWVKVFHYVTQDWTWLTLADGGHNIFVEIKEPGRFSIELSGRSSKFSIDRIALHKENEEIATDITLSESQSQTEECEDSEVPVGIAEMEFSESVKLYPNPVKDQFLLDFGNGAYGTARLWLTNLSGKILMQKEVVLEAGKINTPLEGHLAAGTYILKVNLNNKQVGYYKLIKSE